MVRGISGTQVFWFPIQRTHRSTDLSRVTLKNWVVTPQSPRGEDMTGRNCCSSATPPAIPDASFLLYLQACAPPSFPSQNHWAKLSVSMPHSGCWEGKEEGQGHSSRNSIHMTYLEKGSERVRNWSKSYSWYLTFDFLGIFWEQNEKEFEAWGSV